MTEKVYQFKVTDKKLQDYLDSQPNKSDFLRQLAQDLKDGKLVYLSESIEYKLKEARLENLGYKNRIEKVKADYAETFGKPISTQGQKAVETRFDSARPQTATQLSINATLRFMESCKQNELGQWVVICEKCRADFIDTNREKAVSDLRDHLQSQHAKELLT